MYPLSRRRRIPSALILRAALTSLSCSAPQWGHIQCLVPKSFVPAHKAPHSEQSWEDGNHLSMTASCFPCSRSLYSKIAFSHWKKAIADFSVSRAAIRNSKARRRRGGSTPLTSQGATSPLPKAASSCPKRVW